MSLLFLLFRSLSGKTIKLNLAFWLRSVLCPHWVFFYKPALEEWQTKRSKSECHMDWQVDSLGILRHLRHMDPRGDNHILVADSTSYGTLVAQQSQRLWAFLAETVTRPRFINNDKRLGNGWNRALHYRSVVGGSSVGYFSFHSGFNLTDAKFTSSIMYLCAWTHHIRVHFQPFLLWLLSPPLKLKLQ